MANKAQKRQKSEQSSNNKDRISVLPVPIMHHILSFLPLNEAMMTTFLSRAWRDVWIGLPALNLDELLFRQTYCSKAVFPKEVKLEFFDFVDQTLKKRSNQSYTGMASLKLYVPTLYLNRGLSTCLDRWINLAVNYFKVEELIFNNASKPRSLYKFVINAYVPTLPLKRLELHLVTLGPDIIECLSRHCPLMERLCFYFCNKLVKPGYKVSGFPKLVEFVLHYDNFTKYDLSNFELEIDAPGLRLLEYNISHRTKFKADTCVNLKDLWLCHVTLSSHWHLSLLSKLVLTRCHLDTNVVISSNYLKTLSLWDCIFSSNFKVRIEAPALKYFNFSGRLSRSFELNHWRLEKAVFHQHSDYAHQLVGSLAKINPCKELEIVNCHYPRPMIIAPERRQNRNSPLPDVKHIKLRLRDSNFSTFQNARLSLDCFLDTLLWLSPCPLTFTISLLRGQSHKQQEFKVLKFKYYDEGKEGAKKCRKCKFRPVRCWQHHLEEVSIENHRAEAKELTYKRRRKMRAEDDDKIKAFFENARQNEKIVVNVIS